MSNIFAQINNPAGPSVDFIEAQYTYLQGLYSSRNQEFAILRNAFNGETPDVQQARSKPALLQDRPMLAYNILNATIRRYMDSMSQPPRIEGIPEGFDEDDIRLADIRAKWLQEVWDDNSMDVMLIQAAFYQSLLDKAIFLVRPDPLRKTGIRIELIIPETYYPMPAGDDWMDAPFVIIGFRSFDGALVDPTLDPMKVNPNLVFNSKKILLSRNWFVEVENGQEKFRAKHDWGFIPVAVAHNLPIPHRHRGQGDVDQAIGLQVYLNMFMSDMADIINYAANPITVVRGSSAGGANLPFAPRAVWELERDAQVGFLQWSGAPPTVETHGLRTLQAIEDVTGIPSAAMGREIPSGVSGSAVRSLTAGFASRTGTKQQMLGGALSKLNEMIQSIAEKDFPTREYRIVGEIVGQDNGRRIYTIRPGDFKGWYKNRIVFVPEDPTAAFFQEMEKFNKGIQSRETTMRKLGIQNISDELERIKREKSAEVEHANNMALAQQGNLPMPDMPPEELQARMEGMMGIPVRNGKPVPPRYSVPGQSTPGGMVTPAGQEVTSVDVQKRLKEAGLMGNAAVTGELAAKGATSGPIEVLLDDRNDEAKVYKALSGLGEVNIRYRDVSKPPRPEEPPIARGSLRGPLAETRSVDAYLRVAVVQEEKTNTGASVYTVAVEDGENLVPIAKTFPQSRVQARQGELISVHIAGLVRRELAEGIGFKLVKPEVVRSPMAPAKISTSQDIMKLWDKSLPTNEQQNG